MSSSEIATCTVVRSSAWTRQAVSLGLIRALDSPEATADSPCELWNAPSLRGTPLALVTAGVLASSPHNTQAWLFKASDHSIKIFADGSRSLGAMNSFLREMHIGLGCAIENMALAAPLNGYALIVEAAAGSLIDRNEQEKRMPVASTAY